MNKVYNRYIEDKNRVFVRNYLLVLFFFFCQKLQNKCYFFVMKSITNIKQPIEVTETYCFLSQINIIGNFILAREIENGSTVPNH